MDSRSAKIRFAVLLCFLAACVVLISIPASSGMFDHEALTREIGKLGRWAYVAYVVFYGFAVTAVVPGTVVTLVGASLFSLGEAFALTLCGAMFGASLSFVIGRQLGRGWVSQWLDRTAFDGVIQLISRFESRGIAAVAYLRIAYVPFPMLNYAAPLTGIRFRDYFIGTFLGILPGTFVFVFMGNTLSLAWRERDFSLLWGWQSVIALVLFAFSLLLPKLLKRFENRTDVRE